MDLVYNDLKGITITKDINNVACAHNEIIENKRQTRPTDSDELSCRNRRKKERRGHSLEVPGQAGNRVPSKESNS